MEYRNNEVAVREETLSSYTAKTFFWMFIGLGITFGIGAYLAFSGLFMAILETNPFIWLGVIIAELVVVFALSALLKKMSTGVAYFMFILYAVLNGVTFASVFLTYDVTYALLIFGVTAVTFGIMAAWGYFTKQDLSSWGKVLLFGLFGLLIMGVLGLFLDLSAVEFLISLAGVAIFLGYTAYDTQKIKAYYYMTSGDQAMRSKASIISALQLYLDFVNLFLYLLRLLNGGSRRND